MLARAKMLLFTALLLGLVQSHADPQPGDAPPLSVEIDQPRSLVLEKVSSQRTANGIEVSGRVAKRSDHRGHILGHVDITLVDTQGQPLARHVAALEQFSPSRIGQVSRPESSPCQPGLWACVSAIGSGTEVPRGQSRRRLAWRWRSLVTLGATTAWQ
jgi:hypothetical protein